MKTFQITSGILAILAFTNGIVCLFTQPFISVVTNDRVFAASFLLGCCFVLYFLWANNQINGTINNPINRK